MNPISEHYRPYKYATLRETDIETERERHIETDKERETKRQRDRDPTKLFQH